MPKKQKAAFTLIEMLVVIGIIALMIAATTPAVLALVKSNKLSAARNLIRSALVLAQAHAAQSQRYAGVRFQFDRDGWEKGQQYLVLIEKAAPGSATYEYNAIPNTKPATLPMGIGVIALNAVVASNSNLSNGNLDDDLDHALGGLLNATTFSIIFSPTGQMVVKKVQALARDVDDKTFGNQLDVDTIARAGDPPSPLLYYDNYVPVIDSVSWCEYEPSTTGFYIYETQLMAECEPDFRYDDYVEPALDPILINAYTGTIIKD